MRWLHHKNLDAAHPQIYGRTNSPSSAGWRFSKCRH